MKAKKKLMLLSLMMMTMMVMIMMTFEFITNLTTKQQRCTCTTVFVHFFAVTARLRHENA